MSRWFRGRAIASVGPHLVHLLLLLLLPGCLDGASWGLPPPPPRRSPREPGAGRCEVVGRLRDELDCRECGLEELAGLPRVPGIRRIDLAYNNLTELPARGFDDYPELRVLILKRNQIARIDDEAFGGLKRLKVLELEDNHLREMPKSISRTLSLEDLTLANNKITQLAPGSFSRLTSLESIDLHGNTLRDLANDSFVNLPRLRTLDLGNVGQLAIFPELTGCRALEILRLDRGRLRSTPDQLCQQSPRLKSLDLRSNRLTAVPRLRGCRDLRVLDLSYNSISTLEGRPFQDLGALHDLILGNNNLTEIPVDAFQGLANLQVLDLESNHIEFIHPDAFDAVADLEDLNLGSNVFPEMPINGLSKLVHLKTFNNPALREFPAPEKFPRVRTMVLSYAYHCCPFAESGHQDNGSAEDDEPTLSLPIEETILFPEDYDLDLSLWNSSAEDLWWPQLQNISQKFGPKMAEIWSTYVSSGLMANSSRDDYLEAVEEDGEGLLMGAAEDLPPHQVRCMPQPGPFLPCRDLFDWWTLRCGAWAVFLLALLGNGTVVLVLLCSKSKMDVPRFLVCNLAAADLFMGVYLGLLAAVDAATLGHFREHAIAWQSSAGCQLAGFLGVLSSELSVYTLAVITLERNYAITHAMHLNKRLSLRHASGIMLTGWLLALGLASLPLYGVSDYRRFAVCLPFETRGPASLAYVVALLLLNGSAFLVLTGCYLRMYCAIRGSHAWNSHDTRIAKRMAILVFTDLLCWSPVALYSLTSVLGLELLTLGQAKVLAVFVLPLNSCCNPFLYAILTKQFKKDCAQICKSLEDARARRRFNRCSSGRPSYRERSAEARKRQRHRERAQLLSGVLGGLARLWRRPPLAAPGGGLRDGPAIPGAGAEPRGHLQDRKPGQQQQQQQQPQNQGQRGSETSASGNFTSSSSRSDSWRQSHPCGIPLRLLGKRSRRKPSRGTLSTSESSSSSGGSGQLAGAASRKPSLPSSASSSNDSYHSQQRRSGTWRLSRSSGASSLEANRPAQMRPNSTGGRPNKPKLTRQDAISDPHSPGSPVLSTIPSAAELSENDEGRQDAEDKAQGANGDKDQKK